MEYRLDKEKLLSEIGSWDSFLKRKVHLIACGGTAMTLLGVKASTQDVDFIVPVREEYDYLIKIIQQLGYKNKRGHGWGRKGELVIFDLFPGHKIHTTDLLDDPLQEGRHRSLKEFTHIYLGVLNDYDLIVSKLFRGDSRDFEDCLQLARAHRKEINFDKLKEHFFEMLGYHPVGEDRVRGHWETFEKEIKKDDQNA